LEEHKRQYAQSVDAAIKGIMRGTRKNQMPSGPRHLVLAHAHTSNLAAYCLKGDARDAYASVTKRRRPKKDVKRKEPAGECHTTVPSLSSLLLCVSVVIVYWLALSFPVIIQ